MNRLIKCVTQVTAVCAAAVIGGGCAAFFQSVESVDPDKSKPMDAKYDYTDLRTMTDEVGDQILAQSFLQDQAEPPVVVIMEVENRTSLHIDTKAMTDTLRKKLMDSGKMRFVDASRRDDLLKEQGYQAQNATPETRVAIGRQVGAKYMFTGAMVELKKNSGREVRVSKKEEIYYQLTIEVTDLETGLIAAAPQVERARQASKPIIGW